MEGSLDRDLVFTDKHELSEYTHDNLLNKELYKAYLLNKDNSYNWKNSPIVTFNELYYQCTCIYNDPNPESEIYSYLEDAKYTLGTRYASNMLFSMVNAVFTIMDNPPENVEFFLAQLQSKLKDEECYFKQYASFAKDFIKNHGRQKISFPYCPVSIKELEKKWDYKAWEKCTNEFDEYIIKKCVEKYKNVEDKLALIDIIERAYDEAEANKPVLSHISFEDLPF